jgi:hypothetical protein
MPVSAPPKFKILVANLAGGSDPSRGPSGNPEKLRTGFVLQQMSLSDGTTRINGPTQEIPPVSGVDFSAAIRVLSARYWDPTVAPPGPFYYQEECRVFQQYPTAGVDFGVGNGSLAGPVNTIASTLATWVNASVEGVTATSVGDTAYFTVSRPGARFPVQATNDTSTLLGGLIFQVQGPGGVVLSGTGHQRANFYIAKSVKTQEPPTIL